MREYLLYIDGEFVESAAKKRFDSINPYNQEVVASVARAGAPDVQKAAEAARKAFDDGPWTRMTGAERGSLLKGVSDAINARKDALAELEVLDSGSTIRKAKEDIHLSARAINYFSKVASSEFTEPIDGLSKPGVSRNFVVREPVGVVGAIIPWNFPLKMAIWKLGPALA